MNQKLIDVNNKILKDIESYYLRAWKAINNNDYKLLCKILHNEMPVKLYDLSLNIMFDKRDNPRTEELKHLINKVDDKLNEYNTINKESLELDDNIRDF